MSFTITWYGHAAVGLETGGFKLLVDPYFKDNPSCSTTAESMHPDFILVSHGLGDHTGDAVSIAKRTGALVISNAEIAKWLAKQGVKTHAQHLGGGFKHALRLPQTDHGAAWLWVAGRLIRRQSGGLPADHEQR